MPWSAGSYSKANNATGGWVGDASLGIGIEAGRHDTQDNDFATGINQCLNKDGSNSMSGDLNLGNNKPVNINAGTAAAPALCMNNDTNTGLFSAAADQIGIATNGTERVRIDATGRVGIGTTAPGTALHVSSSGDAVLRIEGTGGADNDQSVHFKDTTSDWYIGNRYGGGSPSNQSFGIGRTAAKNDVVIDSAGRVGIGTNAPALSLDMLGNANTFQGARLNNPNAGSSASSRLQFGNNTSDQGAVVQFNSSANTSQFAGADSLNIVQGLNAPLGLFTNGTERIRITGSGNVGIGGNTVGAYKLYVKSEGTTGSSHAIVCENSVGASLFGVLSDGGFSTGTAGNSPYNLTTGNAANVYVESNGILFRSTSSLKYKQDIEDMSYGLNEALQVRPVTFAMKGSDGQRRFAGLIAEDIDALGMTEFVQYANDETPDAINYANMVALSFKAIQELNAKVESLEARVAELEA